MRFFIIIKHGKKERKSKQGRAESLPVLLDFDVRADLL